MQFSRSFVILDYNENLKIDHFNDEKGFKSLSTRTRAIRQSWIIPLYPKLAEEISIARMTRTFNMRNAQILHSPLIEK